LSAELGETTAPSVVSGGLWTLLNRVLPQAQLLVLSIIVARYLGPTDMGRQSFIAFVAIALVQVATAGMPIALVRFIGELIGARRGGHAMSLYAFTRRVERVAAALVAATLIVVALAGADPRAAWALAGVSAALAVLQAVPMSLLAGAQRWREGSVPGLVTGIVTVPLTIVVLEAGGGITGLFGLEAAAVFTNLLWTSALARRLGKQLPEAEPVPPELRRRVLSFAGSTSIIVIIHFVVWRRSELFVLQHYSTDSQIAFYSIAFAAISGLSKLPETIEAVSIPAVANLVGTGEEERIRRGFWRAMRLLVLATLPLVAGVAVTGPALLTLAYGEAYAGAGSVLLVMLAPVILQPMLRLSEGILYALGRVRFIVIAGLFATAADLLLAFLLIPSMDAVGAAIANGVAILVAGVPALALAVHLHRPVSLPAGPLLRALLVALAVAGASWAALSVGTLVAVVAGVLAFFVVAFVVRPLSAQDAEWLSDALGRGGARGVAAGFVRRIGAA
jgi:O-antigen/teichoic acid export membrane protein